MKKFELGLDAWNQNGEVNLNSTLGVMYPTKIFVLFKISYYFPNHVQGEHLSFKSNGTMSVRIL